MTARRSKRPSLDGLVRLSDVEERPLRWLWRGYIPRGKITVLDGDPSLGKSTVTLDIIARVTHEDGEMPDQKPHPEAQVALIVSGEDDLQDTIVPRLRAAGADVELIYSMALVTDDRGNVVPFTVPDDLGRLRQHIEQSEAVLVVIDPVMAFMSERVQTHNDASMRRALTPLAQVAQETGAAIVLLRHLNKDGSGGRAMYRGGGSIAIAAAARSVLLVAPKPGDPHRRVMAQTKSNLAREVPSLEFEIEPWPKEPDIPIVRWRGKSEYAADDLLAPKNNRGRALLDAKAFVKDMLGEGPLPATEVTEAAAEAEITETTLKRARAALGVHAFAKRGPRGRVQRWFWHLPDAPVVGCDECPAAPQGARRRGKRSR